MKERKKGYKLGVVLGGVGSRSGGQYDQNSPYACMEFFAKLIKCYFLINMCVVTLHRKAPGAEAAHGQITQIRAVRYTVGWRDNSTGKHACCSCQGLECSS